MPNKERERHYLRQFRHCLDLPPDPPVESERPDFIVMSPLGRIGVELTEYHHPPDSGERPYQELQSLKDQIITTAERLHGEAGGPALYVTATFGHHAHIAKATVASIARSLAEGLLSCDVPKSIHDPSLAIPRGCMPPEIAHARVHGSIDGVDKLWHADNGGWVATIGPADVQRELDRKAHVASAARSRCDLVWLVIVHDLLRGAPSELSDEARAAFYQHAFDRVFWLDPHHPAFFELRAHAG